MIDFSEKMKNALDNIDGAIACIFSGLDGIGVANIVAVDRFDPAVLDVELATMLRSLTKVANNLKLEKVDELALKAGDLIIFVKIVGSEYFVGIVLNNDANLGRARLEIRKIIPLFEKELYS
ncbi:hypothetical protein HZA55_06235 [Candidatus Poribacteria bacterium]|nr:hypothetical protein [Candidatus Poribacteria bacterium]